MDDQQIWYRKMGNQGPCFKGVQMSHTKDMKMEGNMVGKEIWWGRIHKKEKMV